MEDTTTVAPSNDGVEASTQPVEDVQQPAEPPQEPVSPSEAPAAQVDETVAWLEQKGISKDDPEFADKVLKMAYNSEKLMTKATQEAAELKKALTPSQVPQDGTYDPMQDFVAEYRQDKLITNFKENNPGWEQHRPQMVDLLGEVVATPHGQYTREQLVNEGILTLDDVYAMAKGRAPVDTSGIKSQAQQEVLQTLANTQRAGGGNAQASETNPQAPKSDPVLEGIKRSRGQ